MGQVQRFDMPVAAVEYQIQEKSGTTRTKRAGSIVKEMAVAVFDTAVVDSSGAANTTIAAHGLGVFIPAKAIITKVTMQIVTGFTSAGSTATIALAMETAADMFAALAVSDTKLSTGPFTAGIQDGTTAHMVQATVQREITATVAVQALTAGKMNIFIDYHIAE
jgi:hypothetical protein